MSKKRINYSSSFKAKVVLTTVSQEKTISQLSSQFHVHPNQISKWKAVLLDNIETLFRDGRMRKPQDDVDINELYSKIGRLEMENDFLKKKSAEFS
jgi:transposase-like protein